MVQLYDQDIMWEPVPTFRDTLSTDCGAEFMMNARTDMGINRRKKVGITADLMMDDSWREVLRPYFGSSAYRSLSDRLQACMAQGVQIYPQEDTIFAAFNLTPFDKVRVVILGQDPYHGPGQAMGLSFSVPGCEKLPPSLRNIFKEIRSDLGDVTLPSGDLTPWAEQGVFLLNSVLTVEPKTPGAHAKFGWEALTDLAIAELSTRRQRLVFLLWGAFAEKKVPLINADRHLVLTAPHPSPFSAHRGFFGCRHFSRTNTCLEEWNEAPIVW